MAYEKRSSPRQDIHRDAIIVDSSGALVGPCAVVNVSASGARIELLEETEAPNKFDLVFTRDGKVRRHCEVAWRNEREIGVRYLEQKTSSAKAKRNKAVA